MMDKEKALKILEEGTPAQRISLYITERDKRKQAHLVSNLPPLLTPQEQQQLLDALDDKSWQKLEEKLERFNTITSAIRDISKSVETFLKNYYQLLALQRGWALAEQMETAINVALLQIPDKDKRNATALGLATNMQLLGCCQSVDKDGLLFISIKDPQKKGINEAIREQAATIIANIGDIKAALEATRETIKKEGFNMPASIALLKEREKQVRYNSLWTKYSDKSQEPELGENASGFLCDLYKPYYLVPKYDNIPLNQETKKMFLSRFLLVKEQ